MVAPTVGSDASSQGRPPGAPALLTLAGLIVAGGWLAGILFASLGFWSPLAIVLPLVALTVIASVLTRKPHFLLIPLAIAALYFGTVRYGNYLSLRLSQSSALI